MKEVTFVHISAEISGFGLIGGKEYQFEGAEEAIREKVEEGWDYCGYFPLFTRDITSGVETISLVFQREKA